MDENPCKVPAEQSVKQSNAFLRWPTTIIEWVVIALVALTAAALCSPDMDEGVTEARKRVISHPNQAAP